MTSSSKSAPPAWIASSSRLVTAFSLAEMAHGLQRRASDGHLFLEHVLEVATLLRRKGADDDLLAAALLHDSVERGTLSEPELRSAMGEDIGSLVMALSEDASIEQFDRRKTALREQVVAAGDRALTVFAADKLSCIKGLRRGIEADAKATEKRTGSSLVHLVNHYRDSVETIAVIDPKSPFLPALHSEFDRLAILWSLNADAGAST